MDKIYRLLPWLTMNQAIDWLQRLTKSPLTSDDLLSLCDADQCSVFIDVGPSRSGTDDEDWEIEVIGSGYQQVKNPKTLICNPHQARIAIVLYGEAFWVGKDGSALTGAISWFSTFDLADIFPIFKSPNIKALADKINAAEQAAIEIDIQQLRASTEQARLATETALLRAHQAEAEIGELRHEIVLATDRADVYRSIAMDVRGTEDELVKQLKHEREARESAESEAAELRKTIRESDSDTVSKRERATYERLIYALAKEAKYKLQQPFADEKLIINYARTIGAKVPEGKGVIAKKLEFASARFSRDMIDYPADERPTTDPTRELADPIRA